MPSRPVEDLQLFKRIPECLKNSPMLVWASERRRGDERSLPIGFSIHLIDAKTSLHDRS